MGSGRYWEVKIVKEEKNKGKVELIEVPTQTAPAFKFGEEVVGMEEFLVRIANAVFEIRDKVG